MARKDIPDWLVCKAYQQYRDDYQERMRHGSGVIRWPYEYLAEWTGESDKVCLAAVQRAETHGLIEYGVSLRSGWLTEAGKALLSQMKRALQTIGGDA